MLGVDDEDVRFSGGSVTAAGADHSVTFAEVAAASYLARVQLFAAGYYRTEGLHWDAERMQGSPFKYFAYGAAATEVEVDGFTGDYRLRRVDIVHDVGDSLSPLIDIGQIEGGFVQGVGWLTLEELRWDTGDGPDRGRLQTQSASTYKLPSFSEMPEEFHVRLFADAREDGAVYGSKAVGEPPLMLAFSVREAIREAVGAFGPVGRTVVLASPATPEAVFWAIQSRSQTPRRSRRPSGAAPAELAKPCASDGRAMDWVDALQRLREARTPAVIVTLAMVRGHAPRNGGAKLVVSPDGLFGTVGGGNLEATAIAQAREMLATGAAEPRLLTLKLSDKTTTEYGVQCCGGEVTMLLEPVRAVPSVAIFGLGHVGIELARILARHELELHLIDARTEMLDPARVGVPGSSGILADAVATVRLRHHRCPSPPSPNSRPARTC